MRMISEEEKDEVQDESIAESGQQKSRANVGGCGGFIRGADPDWKWRLRAGAAHVRRSSHREQLILVANTSNYIVIWYVYRDTRQDSE